MTQTAIEWTDATWNPTTGCDRVSPGCDHCYALRMAKRLKAMGPPAGAWVSATPTRVVAVRRDATATADRDGLADALELVRDGRLLATRWLRPARGLKLNR